MKTVLACILLGFNMSALAQSRADTQKSAASDSIVAGQMRSHGIPGVSLGVILQGKLIKATGYGMSNVELSVPVTPASVFQSGSVAKQFTAMAVMMLVEAGKIRLDDKVSAYLPEVIAASWRAATVRHLLTHTSGIPDLFGDSEDNIYSKGIVDFRRDYTEEELLRRFITLDLDFQPGERWSYSNTGYEILGILIHRVCGLPYGELLKQRVFEPLSMTSTRIISEEDIIPNRSSGYRIVKGSLKNQEWIAPSVNNLADGGMYVTVLDLAKWDAALYSERLLRKSSLEQMWTPVKLNSGSTYPYGFGWELGVVNGHPVQFHTGGNQGFWISISRYPADMLTIVVLTNLDEGHSSTLAIAEQIAAIYVPALKRN